MEIESHRNQKFNLSDSLTQWERLLASWWRATSQSGLAISLDDIEQLDVAQGAISDRLNKMFDQMRDSAEVRRKNLSTFSQWKIISVGEDCFSRTVLTRWGLKPSASFGEKSTPFDLSVHPVSSLVALLNSDFEGYLDDQHLEFSEQLNFCRNTRYRVGFNHETGKDYAANNFQKLKETYEPRIERFREQMNKREKTCFVLHIRNPSLANWATINQLWSMLKDRSSAQEKILICISTWKFGELIKVEHRPSLTGNDAYLINVNYPVENYIWHKHGHQPKGHAFEKSVAQKCAEILMCHAGDAAERPSLAQGV